jgi:hypothetical protein
VAQTGHVDGPNVYVRWWHEADQRDGPLSFSATDPKRTLWLLPPSSCAKKIRPLQGDPTNRGSRVAHEEMTGGGLFSILKPSAYVEHEWSHTDEASRPFQQWDCGV